MLCFVSTQAHAYTMGSFLASPWGADLRGYVTQRHYNQLLSAEPQPLFDAYIFSDLERLNPSQLQQLRRVYERLQAYGIPVFNDPRRACRRLELLQRLHATGINPFNAYPLTPDDIPKPELFPVFIRQANAHDGPLSPLLYTQTELVAEIDKLRAFQELGAEPIVVEYINVANAQGLYHKYGAFRIGTEIIPSHLLISRDWVNKDSPPDYPETWGQAELAYAQSDTHNAMLMALFELAEIEFGRIDYAVVNGQIHVFEINTNPMFVSLQMGNDQARRAYVLPRLCAALRAL
jgi:hypothetical protein